MNDINGNKIHLRDEVIQKITCLFCEKPRHINEVALIMGLSYDMIRKVYRSLKQSGAPLKLKKQKVNKASNLIVNPDQKKKKSKSEESDFIKLRRKTDNLNDDRELTRINLDALSVG